MVTVSYLPCSCLLFHRRFLKFWSKCDSVPGQSHYFYLHLGITVELPAERLHIFLRSTMLLVYLVLSVRMIFGLCEVVLNIINQLFVYRISTERYKIPLTNFEDGTFWLTLAPHSVHSLIFVQRSTEQDTTNCSVTLKFSVFLSLFKVRRGEFYRSVWVKRAVKKCLFLCGEIIFVMPVSRRFLISISSVDWLSC